MAISNKDYNKDKIDLYYNTPTKKRILCFPIKNSNDNKIIYKSPNSKNRINKSSLFEDDSKKISSDYDKSSGVLSNLLDLYNYENNKNDKIKVKSNNNISRQKTTSNSTKPKTSYSKRLSINKKNNRASRPKSILLKMIKSTVSNNNESDYEDDNIGKKIKRISTYIDDDLLDRENDKKFKKKVAAAVEHFIVKQEFVLALCKLFIKYGSPSHKIELNMMNICEIMDIKASFTSFPNAVIVTFEDRNSHTSDVHSLEVSHGVNIYKLQLAYDVYLKVLCENMSAYTAIKELKNIENNNCSSNNELYPIWWEIITCTLMAFCHCPLLFNGNWTDSIVSSILGFVVGCLKVITAKYITNFEVLFEFVAAFLCAFIASIVHEYICYWTVVLAATASLLPGVLLTTSIVEIASKNVISGFSRLFYAVFTSLMLGFGVVLGSRMWLVFGLVANNRELTGKICSSVSALWNIPLLLLVCMVYNISLKSHPRQWPMMSIVTIISYLVSSYSPKVLNSLTNSEAVTPALTSFFIGLFSNIYSKLTRNVGIGPTLAGMLIVTPGTLGVKSTTYFIIRDSNEGNDVSFEMIVIALSISVGLFASTWIVYHSKRSKYRSALMAF